MQKKKVDGIRVSTRPDYINKDELKLLKKYGVTPKQLIEVKGLQGDTSDNIPGVPGVGEKTAISLIKQYKSIDGVYKHIDEQKGKLKEKLSENKDLAYLSKTLGTIDINAPIEKNLEAFQVEEWNKPEVLEIFKKRILILKKSLF